MVWKAKLAPGLIAIALVTLTGCGRSADPKAHRPSRSPVPRPTRTYSRSSQVVRAQRAGPGFLDYCPKLPGKARARYDVMLPGGGQIPGACTTAIRSSSSTDTVTFSAFWDARSVHHGTGTATFTYSMPRKTSAGATPAPVLVAQSGTLPP
ncbi:MAG: hypothetical protein ACRDFX_08105 [Chloroflexota bacterium]